MNKTLRFNIEPIWKLLLRDLGIDVDQLLKTAQLPSDLFTRENASLSVDEYFSLWEILSCSSDDPSFPLKLAQSISPEAFNVPLFAAFCSPNLNIAMTRISKYNNICGPANIIVDKKDNFTDFIFNFPSYDKKIPDAYIAKELVFLVHVARLATREKIKPLSVVSTVDLAANLEYAEYFGIKPTLGTTNQIKFSAKDASMPFLTQNNRMWQFFEPEIENRLTSTNFEIAFSEKVQSTLLEMIPCGACSTESVAKKLLVSKRTLQRYLTNENTCFQTELNKAREKLAKHYLVCSKLPSEQIAFLLGYDDPNSFARAFRTWTGVSPGKLRKNRHQEFLY